ncbi:hypothetical protein [Paenibacillus gansuensis]|uniref:Uncharacterized protein n=1 Tax=Paenibacillus gansuensis TaxID=306542 RepID=A0ABW5PEG5_9BACL
MERSGRPAGRTQRIRELLDGLFYRQGRRASLLGRDKRPYAMHTVFLRPWSRMRTLDEGGRWSAAAGPQGGRSGFASFGGRLNFSATVNVRTCD